MMSYKMHMSVCVLAIWLVVLQVLTPFVHAHLDAGDHSDQANGLHLHAIGFKISDKVLAHSQQNLDENDYAMDAHIVVIEKGLIQKLSLPDISTAIIAIFIFFVIQANSTRLKPQKEFNLSPVYKRGYLSPRAPPHF